MKVDGSGLPNLSANIQVSYALKPQDLQRARSKIGCTAAITQCWRQ